ncbi:MAG: hypothetical protein HQM12_20055, partial [SAR324 cluster bacterium]|nr:hypothetical protein [SAR324 cluster bacterium]
FAENQPESTNIDVVVQPSFPEKGREVETMALAQNSMVEAVSDNPIPESKESACTEENPDKKTPVISELCSFFELEAEKCPCCFSEIAGEALETLALEHTTPLTKMSDNDTDLKISSTIEIKQHNHKENVDDVSSKKNKKEFQKEIQTTQEATPVKFAVILQETTAKTLKRALATLQTTEKSINLWWQILLALGFSANYEFLFKRRVFPQVEHHEFIYTLQDLQLFVSRGDVRHPAKWLNTRLRHLVFGDVSFTETQPGQTGGPNPGIAPGPEGETPFQNKQRAVELERKLARSAMNQHEKKQRMRSLQFEEARKEARFLIFMHEKQQQSRIRELEQARQQARVRINQHEQAQQVTLKTEDGRRIAPQKLNEIKKLLAG